WWESVDDKTGWEGSGWGEDKDFEMVEHLEVDKYGHPTKALFKYSGPVFLGFQHAAMNIQCHLLGDYVEYAKEFKGEKFEDIYKVCPEFKKLNDMIDLLENRYQIKKYRNNEV
ncbi:MAG: hypothetical protein WD512_07110, partial [Candidatus Paceibacterota bacterium]